MTDSHRETVVKKVVAVLTALNIPGATVVRTPTTPKPRDAGPSIQVLWNTDDPILLATGTPSPIQWKLKITIKIIVRGDVPDAVADPFVTAVHNGMLNDISLGGIAQDVTPGQVTNEPFAADDSAAIISMSFDVDFRNQSYSDLTS